MLRDQSVASYFFIIAATILLYLWQLHVYPMINPDGVTYLQAAAAYMHGGIKAALSIDDQAKWPFYSALIGIMARFTHVNVYIAQKILDGLLICMSACLFLYVVRLFSQHRNASLWAIVIWLTWHEYTKWWSIVVRDQGFITCLLLSFCCFYHFINTKKTGWALAWSFALCLAILFRIEGVMYLLITPCSIFFLQQERKSLRFSLWCKLNMVTFVLVAAVVFLFIVHFFTINSLRFAYVWQELSTYFSSMQFEFTERLGVMKHAVFYRENPYSAHILVSGYITLFICYAVGQVTLVVMPPLFFMRRGLNKLNSRMLYPSFIAYCGVAVILPLLFFSEYAFLNGRYLLPLGLFVLLLVAGLMPYIIDSFRGIRKKMFIGLMAALFLTNFVASLFPFGHRTHDELDAGLWLKQHYPHHTVFTDTKRILFYASSAPDFRQGSVREMWLHGILGTGAAWLRDNDSWCEYDLLALIPPPGKTQEDYQLYKNLERQGAIGPILKTFTRKANGEDILIASIKHPGCQLFVQKSIKNG